jgi:hypothetical protein
MIEVFKTNVTDKEQAIWLIDLLEKQFPGNKINFDLHDCDRILRIDGFSYTPNDIMNLLTTAGYQCELLTT